MFIYRTLRMQEACWQAAKKAGLLKTVPQCGRERMRWEKFFTEILEAHEAEQNVDTESF